MPNKCGVVNCKGNYNESNKCRVFKLPKVPKEKEQWLNAIPPRKDIVIGDNFYICEKHWPANTVYAKVPGGSTKPTVAPSIFTDLPTSCLPAPKPRRPRKPKLEHTQLAYFMKKEALTSFEEFLPKQELNSKYKNIIISRTDNKSVSEGFKECLLSIIVQNKSTLCLPLTFSAS